MVRYVDVTNDEVFERDDGLELLVQTARLRCSLGHYDVRVGFRIDRLTGPDEYSAVADNNAYTNLMVQHNLDSAADAAQRHHDQAHQLGVDTEELAAWRAAVASMVIPYDHHLGVRSQSEGFTRHQVWDYTATTDGQYPLLLHVALLRPVPRAGR